MLAHRVREHNKKNATREIRATKKNTKRIKNQIIPGWGRLQMTQQAERTRFMNYALAESSRWLLHRRRDTMKINIPGCRKKIRRERKKKRKTKSRKQGTKASKQENRTQGVSIATNLPVSATKPRRGPCHTICHLLPALVGNGIKYHCCHCRAPPFPEQINEKQNKTA